jgi:hypothetical protein
MAERPSGSFFEPEWSLGSFETKGAQAMPDVDVVEFVPDPQVAKEFHVSLMTLWRWDQTPAKADLGWPPKVQIGGRNYRHRSQLEAFKAALLRRALAERQRAGSS